MCRSILTLKAYWLSSGFIFLLLLPTISRRRFWRLASGTPPICQSMQLEILSGPSLVCFWTAVRCEAGPRPPLPGFCGSFLRDAHIHQGFRELKLGRGEFFVILLFFSTNNSDIPRQRASSSTSISSCPSLALEALYLCRATRLPGYPGSVTS